MTSRLGVWAALLGTLLAAQDGATQQVASAASQRAPRFWVASPQGNVAADAAQTPILARRLTLDLDGVTRKQALKVISKQSGLELIYGDDLLGLDTRVRLRAEGITLAAALTDVLWDAGFDVVFDTSRRAALVRRSKSVPMPAGQIVGRITDSKTGMGIGGAEVLLGKTPWKAATDTTGRYRLADVDTGHYDLTVRRFGYAKRSQAVTVQTDQTDTVDLALDPVVRRLDELVTTATGRQRRLDIHHDVTTINADSIMRLQPARGIVDLLEGRVPGLAVQHTSGTPGNPSRLRLGGIGSVLGNNDPIVFVDGVRFYAQQSANRGANLAAPPLAGVNQAGGRVTDSVDNRGVYAAPSPLDYIDPNSIETIEVINGPAAATLYGQDAANGVIVITTKKGKPGPTRWSTSFDHAQTRLAGSYPDLVYRWGHILLNGGLTNCPIGNITLASPQVPCIGDSVVAFQLLNDPELTVISGGHLVSGSLGVSGGSAVTYSVTGSYQDEVGLLKLPTYEVNRYESTFGIPAPEWMKRPQDFKRWNVTSTIGMRVGGQATLSLTSTLGRSSQQKSQLDDQLGNLMATFLDRSSGKYYRESSATAFGGNVIDGYYRRVTEDATMLTNALSFDWHPFAWLGTEATAGLNFDDRSDEVFFPRGPEAVGNDTTGHADAGHGRSVISTVKIQGNATAPLGHDFRFTFALGANYVATSIADASAGTSILAPGVSLIGSRVDFVRRTQISDATFGWYMQPTISNSKLNFSPSLRIDGGSAYGAKVSGGLGSLLAVPSLGLSYLLSDEPWFPFKDLVQSLRLRVAYGKATRQPGPTEQFRLFNTGLAFADNGFVNSVTLQSLGNTTIRPERTSDFQGGLDADLLNSRLSLNVTAQRKTTTDMLLSVAIAPSVAGDNMSTVRNIGVIRSTGLNLTANANVIRSGRLDWNTAITLSQHRDLVVRLAPGVDPFYTDGVNGSIRIAPGYPPFGRWAKPILGYADANGDGVLQRNEFQLGDTAVYVGSTLPNYEVDLQTTISLWNRAVTINTGIAYTNGLSQENQVAQRINVFSAAQQGPVASLADQAARANLFTGFSDGTNYNWIQTVSTTRLLNASISYTVPSALTRRLGAQAMSLSLRGQNLGLWTNYRGLDPNVNAFGTGNNVTDTGILPIPRTWQIQVRATY